MSKSVRILQVVGSMNRGGIETWLMHVLRNIDRRDFSMDFLVHTDQPAAYDEEILELGARIIRCSSPKLIPNYVLCLRRNLLSFGPYDVIHSHVNRLSSIVLWLARGAGVPVRVAHSHSDASELQMKAHAVQKAYYWLTRRLIAAHATDLIGVSTEAGRALFGPNMNSRTIYCGIDIAPFKGEVDKNRVRRSLGIPSGALVVGHIGRFSWQKNHGFLVKVFAEIVRRVPDAVLLLIGDGPDHLEVRQLVAERGLKDNVRFLGTRSDIAALLLGAIDVFVLPSLYEGLPLVLMEAQAAGLPMLVSDAVTQETDILRDRIVRKSLSSSATDWASEVIRLWKLEWAVSPKDALAQVAASHFNVTHSIKELESLYRRS